MEQADAEAASAGNGQEAQESSQRSGSIVLRTNRRKRGSEGALLDWIPGSGITNEYGIHTQQQQSDRLLRTTILFRELEVNF